MLNKPGRTSGWQQAAKTTEPYLMQHIQCDRVEEILHDDAQDRAGAPHGRGVHTGHGHVTRLNGVNCLQGSLCPLKTDRQYEHCIKS